MLIFHKSIEIYINSIHSSSSHKEFESAFMSELAKRLRFNLTNSFTGYAEHLADLFESMHSVST